jgi:hypothetical protein
MEIEDLVKHITSATPSLELVSKILNDFPELVKGIIWENATVLHIAARNDVIHGTSISSWLTQNFKVKVNYSNEGGSVPILWALAAYQECKSKGVQYHLDPIRFFLNHPDFNLKKLLLNRGILKNHIKKYYPEEEIHSLLTEARYKQLLPLVSSQQDSKLSLI